jgi:hypothetical protein
MVSNGTGKRLVEQAGRGGKEYVSQFRFVKNPQASTHPYKLLAACLHIFFSSCSFTWSLQSDVTSNA